MTTQWKNLLGHSIGVILLSGSMVLYFYMNIDVDAMYGPGGVKSIAALLDNYPQRDWGTWLMNLCHMVVNNEEQAARLTIWFGHVATLFGAGLCGFRLNQWSGFRAVIMIMLCFSPLLWNTILVGPDGIATGVAWMGIGIAWWSTKQRWYWSIPLVSFGAFLCIFAAKIKITALPCAAYLGVVPILAMKKEWRGKFEGLAVGLICLGVLLYLKQIWMPNNNHLPTGGSPQFSLQTVQEGWQQLQKVFHEDDVIVQLGFASILSLLLPTKHSVTRLSFGILCAGVLCITASTLGMKIRPRYFVAAQIPIFILLGTALTQYKKSRLYGEIVSIFIACFLWLDAVAYHSAWSDMMSSLSGSSKHDFISVPDGWMNRYQKFPRLDHDDHSTIGAKRLHELAKQATTANVIGLPLRDGREHHLKASAGLGGHKAFIATPKFCCEHQPDLSICAAQTLDAILRSNTRLIIPILTTHQTRIPNDTRRWYQLMLMAAQKSPGWKAEDQWGIVEGSGTQKPPCERPPKRTRGFWEIDGEKPNKPHSNSNKRGHPDGRHRK